MNIYTRKGDDGTTALFGGSRLQKDNPRIAAYGEVDELNCCVGSASAITTDDRVAGFLNRIQHELFVLGADLATPMDTPNISVRRVELTSIQWMETAIDELERDLTPIRFFILPGGAEAASRLHLCRAVCRRAERAVVTLNGFEAINPLDIAYLNRLSDFFFVLARWINQSAGVKDIRWTTE